MSVGQVRPLKPLLVKLIAAADCHAADTWTLVHRVGFGFVGWFCWLVARCPLCIWIKAGVFTLTFYHFSQQHLATALSLGGMQVPAIKTLQTFNHQRMQLSSMLV